MVRKLDPGQARAIEKLAMRYATKLKEELPKARLDELMYDAFTWAIDELTAKPASELFCNPTIEQRCPWWKTELIPAIRCYCGHPDFDGKNCPMGRWEK